jgi:hypothetical protein
MSRVYEPVTGHGYGSLGYGCGLANHNPGKTRTRAAGTGFHGYGRGFAWKTPGFPVTFPTDQTITDSGQLPIIL